jgi:hypothetical protein
MEITTLIWRDVNIIHLIKDKKFTNQVIKLATISLRDGALNIRGNPFNGQQSYHLYSNPKLVEITPWGCEFEAEWWGTKIIYLKGGKTKTRDLPKHKVKITAKF